MNNVSEKKFNRRYRQRGLTLVELMVSLAVGLLVTGIVIAMFAQSKRSFIQDDAVAVMQENGRFALQVLSNELLHAGLAGNMQIEDSYVLNGISLTSDPDANCTTTWFELVETPIESYDSPPALNCFTNANPPANANTSVLIVKRAAQEPTTALKTNTLYLNTGGVGYNICNSTTCNTLQDSWEYYVHVYYIADGADGIPGLNRKRLIYDGTSATVVSDGEVVPGIADFAIQFGVDDIDDNVVRAPGYTTALTTANSPLSVTARLTVLAHSLNEDFSKTNTRKYSLYPSETTYYEYGLTNSHYYGRIFTTSVMIRNNAHRMSSALITVNAP